MASAAAAGLEVTWAAGGRGTGQHWYLQPKQLPQVPLGSGSQRRCPSAREARQLHGHSTQERPCHPQLDTGTPDRWEGSQAPSPPSGEKEWIITEQASDAGVRHSAQGLLPFRVSGFGANRDYMAPGLAWVWHQHVPSQRMKALAASSTLRMSQR